MQSLLTDQENEPIFSHESSVLSHIHKFDLFHCQWNPTSLFPLDVPSSLEASDLTHHFHSPFPSPGMGTCSLLPITWQPLLWWEVQSCLWPFFPLCPISAGGMQTYMMPVYFFGALLEAPLTSRLQHSSESSCFFSLHFFLQISLHWMRPQSRMPSFLSPKT